MIENMFEISIEQLLTEVQSAFHDDYRFVTATCVDLGDGNFNVTYHFDKNLELKHYRITATRSSRIPSISKIYLCSILVENEIKELFGLKFEGIAIDYGGHMLLSDDELKSPMAKQQIVIEQKGGKKA